VEWLGDMPEYWEVTKLKRVSLIQGGYAFPADSFGDAGIPVVRMNNIRRGTLDFDQVVRIPEHQCKEAFVLKEGDIVYGLSGSIGATGSLGNYAVVKSGDLPAQLNQRVARFQPNKNRIAEGFLLESLQTNEFYEQVLAHTTGTAQFNVSTNDIGNVALALPSLDEQKQIVNHLKSATESIVTAVDRARQEIVLLREYRTRLIADVVTGKLDVCEAAAQLPDELSNLDAKLRKRMREEIRLLQQRLGITAIYVTHDQAEALAISDRIVVMDRGRISQIGTPLELYHEPANRFVAEFIGEANFLPATIESSVEGWVNLRIGPQSLRVKSRPVSPGPVTVLARPETIRIHDHGEGLPGIIQKVSYLGSAADYTVETALGPILITDYDMAGGVLPSGAAVRLECLGHGVYPLPPE
jgi:ABC-type branched-subunit amino acid transport system ATPase component